MQDRDAEIVIVGGGSAGLSAALTLGRSRRRTIVFDAGDPRNAPARAAHNLFTRDGTPPRELLRIAREQLALYGTVEIRPRRVVDARPIDGGGFELTDEHGARLTTEYLVLATGVIDELPDIPGLRSLWGTGVFHCPYCHGWEVRDEPFVLIAHCERAFHLAQILRGWASALTVCPTRASVLDRHQRDTLARSGLEVTAEPVVELVPGPAGRAGDVVLAGGRRLGPAAVFVGAPVRQRSPLPARLGCTILRDGPHAGLVHVDERGFSGVPGVYVVGDAARGPAQVIKAAYEGTIAATAINNEMLLAGRLPAGATRR